MHTELAKVALAKIKQRISEGDCPATPAYSIEFLEELVVHFAQDRRPAPETEMIGSVSMSGGEL